MPYFLLVQGLGRVHNEKDQKPRQHIFSFISLFNFA
jgi:hypothetical protein